MRFNKEHLLRFVCTSQRVEIISDEKHTVNTRWAGQVGEEKVSETEEGKETDNEHQGEVVLARGEEDGDQK
ncbi:hypothetical protein EYF80_028013 [Liparis tanakae]|uniref:Uncharacterized protein n=1 Tax=Liparis tanakae TaxID=230148 RepID=A0A4Z2H820_9TELE|nr:hypothetical protein EYF80_028013 [Liparis tanakae]